MYSALESNHCVVLQAKNDLRLEKRPPPIPAPNQLLIKVHTVGICGSDVHYWTHGAIGPYVVEKPMIIGHETSGIVTGVGANTKGFQIGDRVAIEPGVSCKTCPFCKSGAYNLCPDIKFFATPPVDGSLAQYIVHDFDFCFKLPDNISFDEGSMIEPLSVAIHSCRRAKISAGQKVLVLGAGPIGLLCLLTARAFGAFNVVITDVLESRLQLAKELGATTTINVYNQPLSEIIAQIKSAFDNKNPDATIECTGVASSIETAIKSTKSGGTVVVVGLGDDRVEIPLIEATTREIDIRGIFRYTNCYPTAIQMLASGVLKLDKLSTAHYTLDQFKEAFQRCLKADVIKVFIHCI